LRKKYQKVFRS